MKYASRLLKVFLVLLLTYFITRWWLATAWSERYWTWLNSLFGGQKLGLASDVELVTVLMLSVLFSVFVVILASKTLTFVQEKANKSLKRGRR